MSRILLVEDHEDNRRIVRDLLAATGGYEVFIKEKVLGAHRAGIRTVILPRRNGPDLDKVPKEVRDEMRFVLIDSAPEALAVALREPAT